MAIGRLALFTNSIFTDFSVGDVRQIPASSGVTVTVYKGGATATAAVTITPGSSASITVGEYGFLRDLDTIFIGTDNSIVATIDTHTGDTTLNVTASAGNSGDFVVVIGSRLTATNAQPSLFRDPGGLSSLPSVAVDSNGFYSFFADEEQCDVLEAIGSSIVKRVMPGLLANRLISHEIDGAANAAHSSDTQEAWTLGDLWTWFNNAVDKASITAAGLLKCIGFTSTAASTVTGGLTVDTLTVTGGSTFPAGDIDLVELASSTFIVVTTISGTTGEDILATYEKMDNLLISKAAASASSVLVHFVDLSIESKAAGTRTVDMRIRNTSDGSDVSEWLGYRQDPGSSALITGNDISVHAVQTSPPTVAKNYEVQMQVSVGGADTVKLLALKHTYTIIEYK